MDNRPSNKLPPANKLALPSLVLGFIAASLSPLVMFSAVAPFYMLAVLPLGLVAIVLARIATVDPDWLRTHIMRRWRRVASKKAVKAWDSEHPR